MKPWSSTRSCQIAIALRPRPSASAISSRYGSHALALGARPGATARSRWTPPGGRFAAESVDTSAWWPVLPARVGGHLRRNGRFWPSMRRRRPRPRTAMPGGLQIAARRLATDAGRLLDAPQRPAQSPQRQDLLLFVVAQDVAHAGEGTLRSPPASTSRPLLVMAGFQVSINGRFWVSTEVRNKPDGMVVGRASLPSRTLRVSGLFVGLVPQTSPPTTVSTDAASGFLS